MITKDNFKEVLQKLDFNAVNDSLYIKHFDSTDCDLQADFENEKLIFPTDKGFIVNDGTTSNFSHNENFVVFECVARLLDKGYRPEHIELEPRWSLGHGGKSGKADICVKNKDGSPYLCIIECKTADKEYKNELANMKEYGGQLFSYWQQVRATKWLVLYTSDFDSENAKLTFTANTINCTDDANYIELAKDDNTLKLYKDATTVENLFEVWKETYEQKFLGDILFDEETVPYDIGVLPLKKKRLVDFGRDDKIVNQFEEILRHNNVSDKENAFNRLIALFIAKLYDEKMKTDESEVDFQYKSGTDTYQKMQDRLQHLHQLGMKEFMKEDVFYVADDYVQKVMQNAIGENRDELEKELNDTITKLKFYTNNDFAFKDVHNKTLFYQNGKILVEMVELFQKYRIIDSKELQLLGDMFEQLLNKGFKQNEGQFFTPIPVTSFIWKCLPLENIILDKDKNEIKYPKIIDYACGAGHFLTEGFREINETVQKLNLKVTKGWERDCIYGIEKDYRLARVSKISLFMHGADNGNIVFGDGLDNHTDKVNIENGIFDILVANPPYSVKSFSEHLELKHNKLELLNYILKDGSEIETLFIERTAQLLKPKGIAAVILPSSILSNSSTSYIKAREVLLKNFEIKSIVQFGSKTFCATGTNTVVLYLQKNDEPPVKSEIINDNIKAIFERDELNVVSDKDILDKYAKKINVPKDEYVDFIKNSRQRLDYDIYENHAYFGMYVKAFSEKPEYRSALKQDEKKHTKENRIKAFYDFTLKTEKEKVYYFALVYRQNTLVVKSPDDNSGQENFLGYSWSNRKGDEGIKIKSSDVNIQCGLLYNTKDEDASIACYVKDAFLGTYTREGSLNKYISVNSLKDMIDFSRVTFDKTIKTTVTKKVEITSKYELESIERITSIIETGSRPEGGAQDSGVLSLGGEHIDNKSGYLNLESPKYVSEAYYEKATRGKLQENDFLICKDGALTGKVALVRTELLNQKAMINEHVFLVRCNEITTQKYLYNFFITEDGQNLLKENITGSAQGGLNSTNFRAIKLPLPPREVQESIVAECDKVDAQYKAAQDKIKDCKEQIETLFGESQKNAKDIYKLSDSESFDISIGRRILNSEVSEEYDIPVFSANVFEPFGKINKLLIKDFSVDSILWGIDGDWMVNVIQKDIQFYPTDHCGVLRIKNNRLEPKYVAWVLNKEGKKAGFKRSYRASVDRIKGLVLTLPTLSEQERIVKEITAIEEEIASCKIVMDDAPSHKQAILDKYLK